jgi:predicted porin
VTHYAPAAMAATLTILSTGGLAADNVSIYGTLNVDIENVKIGNSGFPSRNRVSSNSSNIGFRGQEDLGGGLKAWFQVENDVRVDGSTTGAWTRRNSAVGLTGAWGTVLLGIWDTPYKNFTQPLEAFYTTTIAAYVSIMGNGTATTPTTLNNVASFDRRQGNTMQYWSPKWNGFGFRVAYVPDEAETAIRDATLWSAAASYEHGAFTIVAAYERHRDFQAAGTGDTGWKVGAAYKFGKTRIAAVWEGLEYELVPGGKVQRDALFVSLVHSVGNFDIRAQYINADDTDGTPCVGGGVTGVISGLPNCAIDDSGADQYAVGVFYHFSKRSTVYALYTRLDNGANARYDLGINPAGISAGVAGLGQDPRGFALGIRHRF